MSSSMILDFPVKQEIIDFYTQPDRHYHDLSHIEEMLKGLKKFRHILKPETYWTMALAIIFHDVYLKGDSRECAESRSATFARKHILDNLDFYESHYHVAANDVASLIRKTDYSSFMFDNKDELLIKYLDLSRFMEPSGMMKKRHLQVLKEYPSVSINDFIRTRVQVLRGLAAQLGKVETKEFYSVNFDEIIKGLNESIRILFSMTFNVGLYPGSFNPIHLGHKDIIEQAEKVFDKVILVQAVNPEKDEPMKLEINNFKVINNKGFIGNAFDDIVKCDLGESVKLSMIRGIRDTNDLQHEMNYKQNLIDLGFDYPFVYFVSNPTVRHISSTAIRSARMLDLPAEVWEWK